MSLSRSDKIQMEKITEHKFSIDIIYERHNVTETYDELLKGERHAEITLWTQNHNPSLSMTYVPRKNNGFGGSFKTLFRKHPYATLHTPKFSILFNI